MPTNALSRRGRAFEMTGLKALESNIRDMTAAVCGKPELSRGQKAAITRRAGRMVQETLWEAAHEIEVEAGQRAAMQGWPARAIEGMFAYAGLKDNRPPIGGKWGTSLAGEAKKRSMIEWTAGKTAPREDKSGKHAERKVAPGGKVAMSLATMYEFGTTRLVPRPALRPAITAVRGRIVAVLAEGFRKVIESFAWSSTEDRAA